MTDFADGTTGLAGDMIGRTGAVVQKVGLMLQTVQR